jgi:hypothetical protein
MTPEEREVVVQMAGESAGQAFTRGYKSCMEGMRIALEVIPSLSGRELLEIATQAMARAESPAAREAQGTDRTPTVSDGEKTNQPLDLHGTPSQGDGHGE